MSDLDVETIKHPESDWILKRVPAGRQETEEVVAGLEDDGFDEYARNGKYVSLRKAKPPLPEATDSAIEKAGELGIDLHEVTPSGGSDGNRITFYDVTDHATKH